MEEKIADMNYSEFCEFLDTIEGEDRMLPVLKCDNFTVYFDLYCGGYFYLEGGENDAGDFFELEKIAELKYSIVNDLLIPDEIADEVLGTMFACTVCGERVLDNRIEYLWFKRKRS